MNQPFDASPFGREQFELDRSPLDIHVIRSQPIWRELRTFLAVAKSSSFAQAAELLGVSAPTVSRDVKRLQDQIGSQLVVSTFSGVVLTEIGKRLAMHIAEFDFKLSSLSTNIKTDSDAVAGRVSVGLTSGLAVSIVAPAVMRLTEAYPEIDLDICEQNSVLRSGNNQADVIITLSHVDRADMRSQKIGVLHFVPIASRRYLKQFGVPTLAELDRHAFLQCSYYNSDREPWQPWNTLVSAGRRTHHCSHSLSYFVLVKNGAGIGLLGTYVLVDRELVPLGLDVHISLPVYATVATDRLKSRPVATVFEWLVSLFASPWFGEDLVFPNERAIQDSELRLLLESIAPVPR